MLCRPPRTSVGTEVARELRPDMTFEQRLLWSRLRSAQPGLSFRHQEVTGRYVVDFTCYRAHLITEPDGSHLNSENESVQDASLTADGFTILRL
ncbi:DUF559 domain-containing protein [Deinococcus sp.]|uniref:DUF559 domain-containing protein n=1 Tax=Deinococcus sp. TaxID=47478 RepID=UPI0025C637FE|nr:DUF559 domain-containing protein [Deinococcus sp.]